MINRLLNQIKPANKNKVRLLFIIVLFIWIILLVEQLSQATIEIVGHDLLNYALVILLSLGQIGVYFSVVIGMAEMTRKFFQLFETKKETDEDKKDLKTLNISICYSVVLLFITIYQYF